MRFNQLKSKLANEHGSAMVYTLMVLLLLSLLGISVGMVTVGSYRLAHENQDSTSAYYIAEAGANMAYAEIEREIFNVYDENSTVDSYTAAVSSLVDSVDGEIHFSKQNGAVPTANIKTTSDGLNYTIQSTGEVGGNKRTVEKKFQVNWIAKNKGMLFPRIPDEAALVIQNDISISGNHLFGNIYANTKADKSITIGEIDLSKSMLYHASEINTFQLLKNPSKISKFKGVKNIKEEINFEVYGNLLNNFTVPTIENRLNVKKLEDDSKGNKHNVIDDQGNIMITHYLAKDHVVELDKDVYVKKIESNSNRGFSFDTGGFDYTLLVDSMNIESEYIDILGGGKLTIIVKDSMNVSSMGPLNRNGTSSQLVIVYLGSGNLQFSQWGSKVNGHIIAPNANLIVKNTQIKGVVLIGGNEVTFSGGQNNTNMLLIAPKAKVSLTGGYSIFGNIIASSYEMSGDTKLDYREIDTDGFPISGKSLPEKPEAKELISEGALVEPN